MSMLSQAMVRSSLDYKNRLVSISRVKTPVLGHVDCGLYILYGVNTGSAPCLHCVHKGAAQYLHAIVSNIYLLIK